jgi:short subunit dehydrogenase-like uncharacterized protein
MEGDLLVHGAYGYTGSLITQRAVADGLDPIIAGRSAERVEVAATERGCDHRVFSLEHPTVVERRIADVDAVLNCAGPFEDTAEPLVDACSAPAPTTSTSPATWTCSKRPPPATPR